MMAIPTERLLELYRVAATIRRFEEEVMSLFGRGRLPGFTHSYLGMEAVASGVCVGLRIADGVTSTHRGHGHAIAKGIGLGPLMAELYGRSTGVCKGRGGSMHFADIERGMLGGNGIVAGGLPLATGAALARKLDGTDNVVVAFVGEGGVNQGTFHESLNLAAIWSLPVIYVIENNMYTEYAHYRSITSIEHLSDRAAAYGMPGISVDGQDLVRVHEAASEAIERARQGEGPTLLEALTYRFRGHHEGEEQLLGKGIYRSTEEIEAARRERDPITIARAHLSGIVTEDVVAEIDDEIAAAIQTAVEFAETSPLPEPHEAADFVYTTG
jgi:TPP-dependent pyruvate/acetoin dehydrogenase alpha subunit